MQSPESADPNPELDQSRMTLGEHLDELRVRLIRSAVVFAAVFVVAWTFQDKVVDVALAPFEEKARPWLNEDLFEITVERLRVQGEANEDGKPTLEQRKQFFYDGVEQLSQLKEPILTMRVDSGTGTFYFFLQACGYASMFLGGPYVLWQIWGFIAAGLYKKERRVVYKYFPASLGLFFVGVFFGYIYLVPYAYYFISKMGLEQLRHDALVSEYFTFLTSLGLGMGIIFQLPILMMALSRVGLIEPRMYSTYRGHFILVSFVLAAIITPPDPYTQIMMAGPMALLYEIGIVLAKLGARRSTRDESAVISP